MSWHAEPITLTLRRFEDGCSYANRDKFAAVATAQILGGKRAYISGFLADGTHAPIHKADWLELGYLLRDSYGIRKILTERHMADKEFNTSPAPLS